ncbi:hypothetical protein RND81_10G243200 [Saponaria officinalis]|uniref:Fungal lipase-type domain-containing protein n=1 Tax=Saponaria officinalis TaxID=3572 RepID=A0AAW1I799_SAPOF
MAHRSIMRVLHRIENMLKKQELHGRLAHGVLYRFQSQSSNSDAKDSQKALKRPHLNAKVDHGISKYSSDEDDVNDNTNKSEHAWLPRALEPALQFCRWALPTGNGSESKPPPINRSIAEIIASIQKSKLGVQDWSLSDLTIGLYLMYLRQASVNPLEDVKGVQISSEPVIQDLIYNLELAKGCYRDTAAGLARQSMLRESNILKFVRNSSVLRPGYYIGIDPRRKLVILGIRGTHTVYDLVTDIVSTSDGDFTFDGYTTHFGTAEAARWFLDHEMGTIKQCLQKHEGFKLRLVGHSLGAATASLLAIMLRKKSDRELGFDPNTVTAVGIATPPCVSKELAESCCGYVTNVVMQDDIVPRLSVASLSRLRNEIIQTDWKTVLETEDWKNVAEFLTNAKQVISSVQDVARKVADYANFRSGTNSSDTLATKKLLAGADSSPISKQTIVPRNEDGSRLTYEELFVPGAVYYLKRNVETQTTISDETKGKEYFTLWKRQPGQHFQRILLSSNVISDHKCDSHYYALRDVLKGLPGFSDEGIF